MEVLQEDWEDDAYSDDLTWDAMATANNSQQQLDDAITGPSTSAAATAGGGGRLDEDLAALEQLRQTGMIKGGLANKLTKVSARWWLWPTVQPATTAWCWLHRHAAHMVITVP